MSNQQPPKDRPHIDHETWQAERYFFEMYGPEPPPPQPRPLYGPLLLLGAVIAIGIGVAFIEEHYPSSAVGRFLKTKMGGSQIERTPATNSTPSYAKPTTPQLTPTK